MNLRSSNRSEIEWKSTLIYCSNFQISFLEKSKQNIKSMKGLDYASANNIISGLKKPSSIPNFKVKQKNKIKKRRKRMILQR